MVITSSYRFYIPIKDDQFAGYPILRHTHLIPFRSFSIQHCYDSYEAPTCSITWAPPVSFQGFGLIPGQLLEFRNMAILGIPWSIGGFSTPKKMPFHGEKDEKSTAINGFWAFGPSATLAANPQTSELSSRKRRFSSSRTVRSKPFSVLTAILWGEAPMHNKNWKLNSKSKEMQGKRWHQRQVERN